MKKKKLRDCSVCVSAVAVAALGAYTLWSNVTIQLTDYQIKSSVLPSCFDGFRIIHVSDLHNTDYGDKNAQLIRLIADSGPDIIAITGDLLDSRSANVETVYDFVRKAVKIAPVYYVPGNHESRLDTVEFPDFERELRNSGVNVLRNEAVCFERGGQSVYIGGVDDPMFNEEAEVTAQTIRGIYPTAGFRLLLSHRPELFDEYVSAGMNLVLCGHAHGGQFRLPLVGGLFAPHQGLFPKYDSGVFNRDGTDMVVSRGLGNSVMPLRINNRPELVLIELIKE